MTRRKGVAPKRIIGDDERRFWSKVDKQENGCWLWTDPLVRAGYARFFAEGTEHYAHIWAYKHFVGPVPEGYELDHVWANGCRFRHCVNFESHLEPVTPQENIRRAKAKITHCPKGHPYDETNTVMDGGSRRCRTCRRAQDRARGTRGGHAFYKAKEAQNA